ncbi:DUF4232 domain-containing protein [Brevundimonas sp.]|uniref:DUF4232 domain-containing protein n=1 Tax=Brevundimonas sp. TaxID=1871086 RepID=UPI003B00F84B
MRARATGVRNFSLQNIGAQACSLTGYPTVTLQDGRGRTLSSIRAEQSPGSYFRQGQAPTPVELAPQAKAWFEMAWTVMPDETIQKTCPDAATLKLTAPSDTAAVSLPFAFSPLRRTHPRQPDPGRGQPAAGDLRRVETDRNSA